MLSTTTVTRIDFTIDESVDFDLETIVEMIDEFDLAALADSLDLEDADEVAELLEGAAEAYIDVVDLACDQFRPYSHIDGSSLVVCTGIDAVEGEAEESWVEDLGILLGLLLREPDLAKRAGLVCIGMPSVEQILQYRD